MHRVAIVRVYRIENIPSDEDVEDLLVHKEGRF